MALQNCPRCGKLFNQIGRKLCPACVAQEEEEFQAVKGYLSEHPRASAGEISEATGVSEDTIINYMRSGRLVVAENSSLTIGCEMCGAPLRYGRFCEECSKKLGQAFHRVVKDTQGGEEQRRSKGQRMHTADWFKKERG